MAKILLIPDIHLKAGMFACAAQLMDGCDLAVVLGDLVDDWGLQHNELAYRRTLEAAAEFDRRFPDTLWCVGNHDYCYLHCEEGIGNTGFSEALMPVVRVALGDLQGDVGERWRVVHEVDGTLFSHAGVGEAYVLRVVDRLGGEPMLEECLRFTNEEAEPRFLWQDDSPIWLRPSLERPGVAGRFQVAGHTPVRRQELRGGVLVVDTFSTLSDGSPIGNRTFTVYDTETHEYEARE